jgi:hypothetical protein
VCLLGAFCAFGSSGGRRGDGLVMLVRFWDTRGRLRSSIRVEDGVYKYYIRKVYHHERTDYGCVVQIISYFTP